MASGPDAIRWHAQNVLRSRRNTVAHGQRIKHPRCTWCGGDGYDHGRDPSGPCWRCGGSGQIVIATATLREMAALEPPPPPEALYGDRDDA